MKNRVLEIALHALFFLSGAAALAFQIAWTRMLSTGLGHEIPAVLAVVGAIFGGMTAGAWASECVLNRSARPGRWYGGLELAMGTWALASIGIIPWVNHSAPAIAGLETHPLAQALGSLVLTAVPLLPATAAMGASFPAMERFLARSLGRVRSVGGLYAAGTFGAVCGIALSVGWSLPTLGFSRTVALFAGLSLAGGAAALVLEHLACAKGEPPSLHDRSASTTTTALGRRPALALWAAGLLGIGFEVLGVRLLAQVLENTVYTFAAVLTVYLLGTAAGGAVYQLWNRRWASEKLFESLAWIVVAEAWFLAWTPRFHEAIRAQWGGMDAFFGAEFLTAAAVFAIPTLLMGATLSHLVQSARQRGAGAGHAVAWNTFGSALAPLVFGVILLPAFGAKWALALLTGGYLALAWLMAGRLGWLAVLPMMAVLALPGHLPLVPRPAGETLLARREGISDTVAVVQRADGHRNLVVNNRFMMGGTGAAVAERRQGTIPLLLHPNPARALLLGLGTGITFAAACAQDGLAADGVELVPEIVELMPWFRPYNAIPDAPGQFTIYAADARRFIRVAPGPYDVIVADLFHPARDGAGPLYSLEHFRAMRSRLAPGGLVCQWLPLYQLDAPTLRVIVRTFMEVFPDTHAFMLRFNVDTPVLGLFGGLQPGHYGGDYLERRVTGPKLAEQLQAEQLRDAFQLLGCHVAGPDVLGRFCAGARLNTDDMPVVLFQAPRAGPGDRLPPYGRLMLLLDRFSSKPHDLLRHQTAADIEFAADLDQFIAARNAFLHGLVAETEGDLSRALDLYVESARLSPRFTTGYSQALSIAMREHKSNPDLSRRLLGRLAAARPERPVAADLLNRLFP